MRISLPKLKALLLFFGTYTDPRYLGKVKLMKLFYFLDFLHLKRYGSPITYDNYVNLEHGPIPSEILNLVNTAIDDIDNSVLSDTISFETPTGTTMQRIIPARKFSEKDKKYFSKSQLEIMEQVARRFGDKNTKFIEEASHKESPWNCTNMLDNIPYTLAAKDKDCLVSEEEIALLLSI
ncbi:MAG: Panacea domain-containing protein [Patescibacteria group bacterium]|nr:Panacea domain-containing protein [Patescibacteria group bacterium]MDD5294922.1 Panacea domain-containing protein [Patescibacteria group bacterium]MDD5554322.1 Panacea domain-containing protein [Patescibacteria group bacterium]